MNTDVCAHEGEGLSNVLAESSMVSVSISTRERYLGSGICRAFSTARRRTIAALDLCFVVRRKNPKNKLDCAGRIVTAIRVSIERVGNGRLHILES